MTTILGPNGQPAVVGRKTTRCPGCGAPESERIQLSSFGGHTTTCCQKCGFEFEEDAQ